MDPSAANQATALNNNGICYLSRENYDVAVRDFSRGLSIVKQVLARHEDTMGEADVEADPNAPQEAGFYFAPLTSKAVSSECMTKGNFVFTSPIVVSPERPAQEPVPFQHYVRLSFVLLYNLALAHHMSTLEEGQGPSTTRKLQKALSLYELAYTIQMTEDIELSVMQTMAIVNNLGQVHTALGAQDKSEQCFQHLLSTIMFINDCGEQENVQQMDGFLDNVMPLILKGGSIAPAA